MDRPHTDDATTELASSSSAPGAQAPAREAPESGPADPGSLPADPGSPPVESPAPAAPGFGTELRGHFRYKLYRKLGRGAFGSVFLARCLDRDPRRDDCPPESVALKILGSRRGKASELLKRELSAMLALEHDRIPKVYDWNLEGDTAFVVMENFPSGSLRDVMPLQGAVEEEAIWRLLADLLSALDVAHRASLLHLDIKPANVLLDGNGGYVLTDFGVSQASRIERGLLPFSVGSRGYQAPEQRQERFDRYDLRTDLWSVGATAWAMATGLNLAERCDLVREDDGNAIYGLPPLSEFRLNLSPELEEVIMSLLHLDPALRPGSVAEVLARVQAKGNGADWGADTLAAAHRSNVSDSDIDGLIERLVDPLLISICRRRGFRGYFVKFGDGEVMCAEGEKSYYALLLLQGSVVVSRNGKELTRVSREGSFLGEVATLASIPRTATMKAAGEVWACVLNAAELERFLTCNPAMALRVIRYMAYRLSKIPPIDEKRGD
ncbi:MAG: protein kinase [bacterium]|nr:protein kinase [bacterium]